VCVLFCWLVEGRGAWLPQGDSGADHSLCVKRANRDVVLVAGATGRIGRLVVDELLRAGASVRALTRRPKEASLPVGVEVVVGDFTINERAPSSPLRSNSAR
jgi:hypothetical protein